MKNLFILAALFVLIMFLVGCSADDPVTEKIYLIDFDSLSGSVTFFSSDNGTFIIMQADNVTAGTLLLNALPTADPGISGAVWSDNGTLKVSP